MASISKDMQARAEKLKSVVTCPICNKFFKDATAIFCRKCISKKITEENLRNCPVCDKDLGCAPLEKLRMDHDLQDIRTSIKTFAKMKTKEHELAKGTASEAKATRREVKEPEVVPSIPLFPRRKERSLSSLVSTPGVANNSARSGRRKHSARKATAFGGSTSTLPIEEPITKVDERPESSNSPLTLNKIMQDKKQASLCALLVCHYTFFNNSILLNIVLLQKNSAVESSKQHMPDKATTEQRGEPFDGMTDLWKPLNCLVEAGGMTKSNMSHLEGSVMKSALPNVHEDVPKGKGKECAKDSKNTTTAAPSGSTKPRKMRRGRKKREVASERLNIPAQEVVDTTNRRSETRVTPIWLSLVASDKQ
ncbi:unnamed protein product [Ilex paraguariensis]|uniref:RING-type domain-containing protein n=1 Tax=Ilex paraguariensis TaxID=185542 RepID=A0ABC8THS5_9AQUA